MTMYDAGTAALTIVPSFRGIQQTIDAEVAKWNASIRRGLADAIPAAFRDGARSAGAEGAKAGEEFGGSFARTVRTRIESALKALPKVELKADSSDADRAVAGIRAQLEALHSKRLGVDIDEGAALAELAGLQAALDRVGSEHPSIVLRVDAARASAELAGVQAQADRLDGRTVTIRTRVEEGATGLIGSGPGLGTAAALAAGSSAIPLGAAAVGGAAGIATLAGSGIGALGVLGLGLSNIKQAVTDIAAAHTAAGKAAAASGDQQVRQALAVASAERGVTSAQAGLANARANAADAAVTAAERVEQALAAEGQAEQNLTRAQRAQKDAQTALTEARKTAAEQLLDLQNAVADGALSQRQADLDVQRAREHLQKINSNPQTSALERQQAQLDFDSAVQRQKDLAVAQQRLVDQQKAAAKAGVDGSAVVVQAQKNLVAANDAVTQAYTAQKTAAQGVSDALRAQSSQARQSAYAIQQAQTGVVNAFAAVQAASVTASSATSTQLDTVRAKLAALSPAALSFATFINSTLRPAFEKLRDAAQAGLLPGLQAGLTALLPVLPSLTTFVGTLAKTMGDLFAQASKALTSPFWQSFFGYVQATAGPTIQTFARVMGNLAVAFAGLLMAFKPVSDQIGQGLLHLTERFADFGQHLGASGGFQSFLDYIQTEGPVVAAVFGNLAVMVGNLIAALAPFGALLLSVTESITGFLAQISPGALLAITTAVTAMFVAFKVGLIALKVNALESASAFAVLDAVMAANPIGLIALAVGGLAASIAFLARSSKDTVPEVDLLAEAEDRLTDAVDKLNRELRKSIDNFTILKNGALTQERANENLQAAFDAVTKSIRKNGATLDLNTAAGRDNRAALLDVITALNDKVTADFKANEATMGYQKALKIASAEIATNRERLIKLAVQSGLTRDAAKRLIDTILLTPKQVTTRFLTPDLQIAQARADNLKKSLQELKDGKWLVKVLLDPSYTPGTGVPSTDDTLGGILVPHKAAGGAIYGPGTGTSDSVAAWLSNGEHVWTAAEVQAAGGHGMVEMLRANVLANRNARLLSTPAQRLPDLPQIGTAPSVGEYHQHFHRYPDEQATHAAAVGNRRLLQQLSA